MTDPERGLAEIERCLRLATIIIAEMRAAYMFPAPVPSPKEAEGVLAEMPSVTTR